MGTGLLGEGDLGMHRMRRLAALAAVAWVGSAVFRVAAAQCPALPYQLANGQVSDATELMANFDALAGCITSKGTVDSGTAGQIGYYAGAGSAISGQSVSSVLDSVFGSAQGSILYRGAAGWQALTPGAIGYVLQSGGASADPSWAPSGGGGGGGITTIVGAGISSGAATVALPGVPVIVRPSLASMAWVNQASATATEHMNGPLVLRTVQNSGNTTNLNALTKAVAGQSWTVTVQYAVGNHFTSPNQDPAGLIVYNSVNGRLYVCGIWNTTTIYVHAYNSTSSFNSSPAFKTILFNPGSVWTQAQYVSGTTTLTFSYSIDGFTWEPIYSTSAPFTGVPTAYGVSVGSANNAAGHVLSLNYMAESTP
jgi:hypothetical protein